MPALSPPGDPGSVPVPSVPTRSLAYLVSQYLALSMVFVVREVHKLRKLGFRIDIASINLSDRPAESLTAEEREEYRRTYYVKSHGPIGASKAHL